MAEVIALGKAAGLKMKARSALIVGGGFVGACCALRLCERGLAVTLVDPQQPGASASFGNAGHIAIEQCEPLASWRQIATVPRRLFAFGGPLDLPLRALAQWAPFSAGFLRASRPNAHRHGTQTLTALLNKAMPAWRSLAAAAGATALLRESGHLVVWERAATARKGRADWSRLTAPGAVFQSVDTAELDHLRTLVSAPIEDAVRFLRTGQILSLRHMHHAIVTSAKNAGMQTLKGTAIRLELEGRRTRVVLDDGSKRSADMVLIAAGVGSRALLTAIGHRVPLIAERGYHIETGRSAWPDDVPPVVFEDRSLIVTTFRDRLRLAGFVEFATADTPPDRRKWRRLHRHARQLGIALPAPVTEWMGARPTLPDYLPAIGRSRFSEDLYYAFGHQHLGLTLAPLTADLVAGLVCDGAAPTPLESLGLERFG